MTRYIPAASHDRLSDRDHIRYHWQHYISLVQHKLEAVRNGTLFADMS